MIYEGTIQFTEKTKSGNDRVTKHQYLIGNCNTFGDAEDLLFVENDGLRDLDVIAVKRSKLKEIVNTKAIDTQIFIADIMDVVTDDDGVEHELVYKVALFAKDIKDAQAIMDNYLAQGMDMQLISLKRTKFIDILNN